MYCASHILVKHQGSRRPASWKDPEGAVIRARTRDDAVAALNDCLQQLAGLAGAELAHAFAGMAEQVSDCGSAQKGGDLGVFESGQMMPSFEAATAALAEGGLSGIIDTDSGSHIIMRTPPPLPKLSYRASHILIKHEGSRRKASWKVRAPPRRPLPGSAGTAQRCPTAAAPGPANSKTDADLPRASPQDPSGQQIAARTRADAELVRARARRPPPPPPCRC